MGDFLYAIINMLSGSVFRIFITEKDVIPLGVDYLRILGVSQLFMSLEITTAGAFSGVWKDRAAICDQYCIYDAQDSACADTGSYNTCAERDLVEYYDFEYSERCVAVCMVLHIHAGRETYI